ncbi:spinster family MFS transporter [Steroidobacter sp.]|uniref:spinster family MFS transporter n=1 Tax=Steroidobacter sp. TaxID=1978227 RepID=UPI001A441B4C|nr:MFS transporter [Steroidobacter sp.]MBL8266051.1 MFS transporter [Steroidobacter sp.]
MTDQQKNARFALAVLFGINLMNFFDRQIAGALGEPIRIEFGLNDTQLGFVATVFTLVYAAVGVPLGRLTDNWLRTRLIAIGVTFWSVLTAASGLAWNYTSFLLTRVGVGIGEASCAPAGQSLIGDLYPPERRARAMAIFMLGLPLGLFAAYMLAGVIGQAWGWRAAFFVACVPGLLLAVLALFIKEPPRGAVEARTSLALPVSPYRTVMRIKTLWWIVLSGMLFNFNSYAVNVFQTPFLQRFHELGLKDANTISAVSLGLTGAIGLLVGGWLGDRLRVSRPNGRVLVAAYALLLAAPCVFLALQQPKGGITMFAILMGASSALSFAYYSTVYSAIQDVVAPNLRGTAVSLYFFAMYVLGASFGSTVMGALSDHFAHQAMLTAGAAEMEAAFRASGLHSAMYVIPALMLLCSGSLFGASRTITADMKAMQTQSN